MSCRALPILSLVLAACAGEEPHPVEYLTGDASRCSPWFPVDIPHQATYREAEAGRDWLLTYESVGIDGQYRSIQEELGADPWTGVRVESIYTCDDAGVWLTERFFTNGEVVRWDEPVAPFLEVPADATLGWVTDASVLVDWGGEVQLQEYVARHEVIDAEASADTEAGVFDTLLLRTTVDGQEGSSDRHRAYGVGLVLDETWEISGVEWQVELPEAL